MKKTEIPEPRAEKIDKIMTIHDHQRIDEFYWLNERENPKVIEYLNAENSYRDMYMEEYLIQYYLMYKIHQSVQQEKKLQRLLAL